MQKRIEQELARNTDERKQAPVLLASQYRVKQTRQRYATTSHIGHVVDINNVKFAPDLEANATLHPCENECSDMVT